ncbi:MAG: DUF898 family protein [Bacteriovoracaceae bacterium]|nr:DUF898 family protein [Bacteriovoracaceae bacterium]
MATKFIAPVIGFSILLFLSTAYYLEVNQYLKEGAESIAAYSIYGVIVLNFFVSLLVMSLYLAFFTEYRISHTKIGELSLKADFSLVKILWITATNGLILIATLGLGLYWTRIRKYHYYFSRIEVTGEIDYFDVNDGGEVYGEDSTGAFEVFDFDGGVFF